MRSQRRRPLKLGAVLRYSSRVSLALAFLCSLLPLLMNVQYVKDKILVVTEQSNALKLSPPATRSINNQNATFSACLLVMDDNHFLVEWLAYHYHTLPLRYLIIAVDSKSRTSPTPILNKWRQFGLQIEEWKDDDYLAITIHDVNTSKYPKLSQETNFHRIRQNLFYDKCLKRLKHEGKTWTLLVDTDEYLAYNTFTENLNTTVETQGTFMSFLQEELQKNTTHNKLVPNNGICIMMPRLRYGAKETAPIRIQRGVPRNFNASAFQTLRWRKHAPLANLKINKVTKAMLDVSKIIDDRDFAIDNLHHPTKFCPQKYVTIRVRQSLLVVRHYLGTYEQFTFRDDIRKRDGMRSQEAFQTFENSQNDDNNKGVTPWLNGFIGNVGMEAATMLLAGVGDVHYKHERYTE